MKLTPITLLLLLPLYACGSDEGIYEDHSGQESGGDAHDHDGDGVPDHGPEGHEEESGGDDHEHDEVALGTTMVGDLEVTLAQGHGAVEAGKEGHLVVKLPYTDSGATIVRAWIGGADRTLSAVGKADYAAGHDDYDVHAEAPDPLPADALWWVEVEKPDGSKQVGSIQPILPE